MHFPFSSSSKSSGYSSTPFVSRTSLSPKLLFTLGKSFFVGCRIICFFDTTSNSVLLCEILPLIIFLVDGILKPIVAIISPYGEALEYVKYDKILTILGIKL